jgi:hypothetical protein
MMTVDQITKTLKCSRQTALTILEKAGLHPIKVPFSHGIKHFYETTPERLLKIREKQHKDPEKIALQQAVALTQIESVFLRRF